MQSVLYIALFYSEGYQPGRRFQRDCNRYIISTKNTGVIVIQPVTLLQSTYLTVYITEIVWNAKKSLADRLHSSSSVLGIFAYVLHDLPEQGSSVHYFNFVVLTVEI